MTRNFWSVVTRRFGLACRASAVLAALCITLWTNGGSAVAEDSYPSKPIRIVVGFSAGGGTDIITRVLASKLGGILGQQVYVENRVGAGGTIATEAVARAEPDGYTLLMAPFANAVNETLFKNFRYKLGENLMVVAPVADAALALVAHPSIDIKSVADLIALAKASPPGDVLLATAGRGSATHLTNELFNMTAGVKTTSVHYRGGGDTVKDLLSGQIKVMFVAIPPVLELIKAGSMRGIATTGTKRDSALPDLPSVSESGLPGFEVRLWNGLLAPAGTPPSIIEHLSKAVSLAMEAPDLKAAFAAQGVEPLSGTREQFELFYRSEVAKWRAVIEANGLANE